MIILQVVGVQIIKIIMVPCKKEKSLAERLQELGEKAKDRSLSLEEILKILAGKGSSLVLLFLSLPFCQPFQIPGLSIPFGLIIAFLGLRMSFGKHVLFPKFLLKKQYSSQRIQKITKIGLKICEKFKVLTSPRLQWFCHSQILNGLVLFLLGIFLALPLPIPLTNLVAGWSIFSISIGLLEADGLFVLLGYLLTVATALFFIIILWSAF